MNPEDIKPETVQPVGIKKTTEIKSDIDKAVFELDMLGYAMIESGFSDAELDDMSHRMDDVMERQRDEAGGAEHMKTEVEKHIARCILAYDDTFLKGCRHPKILEIVERVMGKPAYLNQQNAILNPPGDVDYVSLYHRDFPHQHFTSSHPLSLTILLCIDDFRMDNGPTMMLPGSHKIENFPDEAVWRDAEVALTAKRGTYLVFDSMTFHRTGKNNSGEFRRALVQVYSIPLIKQVISIPQMCGDKYKDDPELAQFLGYPFETADSVLGFRKAKGFAK